MVERFGEMPDGTPVYRIAIGSESLQARVLTFGAVLQSIEVADRGGRWDNVVLGLSTLAEYVARSPHFGAVPGRYAGRIGGGRFSLDGVAYQLVRNKGANTIHGGPNGFGKRAWTLEEHGDSHVVLRLTSEDGDAGFPGRLQVRVRYTVEGSALRIDYAAETDKPTVVNLTNHSYFNLAGEGSGDVLGHRLTVDSGRFLPIDAEGIPTGEMRDVAGTAFDFRGGALIGARIREGDPQILYALGYDHAYLLEGAGLRRAALLEEALTGRTLTVLTTEPAVHVYTGGSLTGALAGMSGRAYRQGDGVCFEAEHPQDSPNKPNFPSTVVRPGTPYQATTIFRFGVSPA